MGAAVIPLPRADGAQANLLPDLTPLLDVIFIVLVFFLLTAQTPLMQLAVQLPQSREQLPTAVVAKDERVRVQLDAAGNWQLDGALQADFATLRSALLQAFSAADQPGLDLALDRQAPLSAFLDLMALLQQQGVQDSRILLEAPYEMP